MALVWALNSAPIYGTLQSIISCSLRRKACGAGAANQNPAGSGQLVGHYCASPLYLGVFMLIYASPLLLTIRTQARGLLANLDYPTRVQQLFIMFAPFVLLLITFINRIDWRRENARGTWRLAIRLTLFLLFALSLFTMVIGLISGVGNLSQNLSAFFVRRSQVIYALSTVFLAVGILFFTRQLLLRRGKKLASDFTMLLVLLGMLLVLVARVRIHVHDLFGSRMNTIFKLYYQAWLLFAVAAGLWLL